MKAESPQHRACLPWRASRIEDRLCLGPATRGESFKAFTLPTQRDPESIRAFTLIELLIVVGIIGVLLVLIAPAFTSIKGGTDVTSAAYTIKGVLDTARTYAKTNNTYTWVGFCEEDVSSTTSGCGGTGRIVMSIVASKDGTMLYPAPLTGLVTLQPANLIQLGKLIKVDNVHLITFPAPTGTPPTEFDTRPAVASNASKIGDDSNGNTVPPSPSLQFQYPLSGTSQYQFTKIVQFSPRGEGVIDNINYTLASVSEIGLEPTHGTTTPSPPPAPGNFVAIQFTGLGGNVTIYRK